MKKKIIYLLVLVFIAIQFFRINKSSLAVVAQNDFSAIEKTPDSLQSILRRSCYDCHSNETVYPWYTSVQPLAWWIEHHIDEGRHELNFSEWGSYAPKRKIKKIKEVVEQLEKGDMPLSSYLLIHTNAKLSTSQTMILIDYFKQILPQYEAQQ